MPPDGPHKISVLIELTSRHLRYHLTDVPPQPNSPPDKVSHTVQPFHKKQPWFQNLPHGAKCNSCQNQWCGFTTTHNARHGWVHHAICCRAPLGHAACVTRRATLTSALESLACVPWFAFANTQFAQHATFCNILHHHLNTILSRWMDNAIRQTGHQQVTPRDKAIRQTGHQEVTPRATLTTTL